MKTRTRVFDLPHKALRNLLGKFSFLAGRIDNSDPDVLKDLKNMGSELLLMLESHMHFEEAGILTEMDKRASGSIDQDREEHKTVEPIQADLFNRLNKMDGSETESEMHQFYLDFVDFQSDYLKHLHHEETQTEKLLWENFNDEELTEITIKQFVEVDPSTKLLWLKYGIPSFTKTQRIVILNLVKARAP